MSKVRTIMSGSAMRSMTTAIVEIAAVPTNSVESSTARTNRGDLGAPRRRSQSAANATVETRSGALLRLCAGRCSQSEAERFSSDEAQRHESEHATEPGEPGLPQLVIDGSFGGIHEDLYAHRLR